MVTPIDIKGKTLGFIDSRIGGRKENQDSAGIKETQLGYLVVVCDGMGGMQGGSTASQLAVKTILETVASADKQSNPSMTLIKAIRNANMAISMIVSISLGFVPVWGSLSAKVNN